MLSILLFAMATRKQIAIEVNNNERPIDTVCKITALNIKDLRKANSEVSLNCLNDSTKGSKMKKILISLMASLYIGTFSISAHAANDYISGSINNLTVTTSGIMIMVTGGLPDNCSGTPYGWMLIEQKNTALTSVVLAAWIKGETSGTFYTTTATAGYCTVNQFDPVG